MSPGRTLLSPLQQLPQTPPVPGNAALLPTQLSPRHVVWKSCQESWARLHEQALRHYGGSCRYVLLDNLKECVLKPDTHEPELSPVYAADLTL